MPTEKKENSFRSKAVEAPKPEKDLAAIEEKKQEEKTKKGKSQKKEPAKTKENKPKKSENKKICSLKLLMDMY